MESIWSFHKHSRIAPVSSAINAFATLAYCPNRVKTILGFRISRTFAFRLTRVIPVRRSLIGRESDRLFFLARYLRIMSVFMRFLIGLPPSNRSSLSIENWATTLESFRNGNMALSCVLPRHSLKGLHLWIPGFLLLRLEHEKVCQGQLRTLLKEKARYSPVDTFSLKAFPLIFPVVLIPETILRRFQKS